MTCNIPLQMLQQRSRRVNFDSIRPPDSDFSKLPPGVPSQTYTVSVTNNGRVFGSSQKYTLLFNSTCVSCNDSGPVQRVSKLNCSLSIYFFIYLFISSCLHNTFSLLFLPST